MVAGERVRGKTIAADGGKGRDAVEAPGDRGSAGDMGATFGGGKAFATGRGQGRDSVEAPGDGKRLFDMEGASCCGGYHVEAPSTVFDFEGLPRLAQCGC